jgi:hypothetical protein
VDDRLTVKIGEYTQRGKKAFKSLADLHPHNSDILYKYASFLAEVCNEDEEADRLISKANFLSRSINDRGGARQRSPSSGGGGTGLDPKAGKHSHTHTHTCQVAARSYTFTLSHMYDLC